MNKKVYRTLFCIGLSLCIFLTHSITAHAASEIDDYINSLTVDYYVNPGTSVLSASSTVTANTTSGLNILHYEGSSVFNVSLTNKHSETLYLNGRLIFTVTYTCSGSSFDTYLYAYPETESGPSYSFYSSISGTSVGISGRGMWFILSCEDLSIAAGSTITLASTVNFSGVSYVPINGQSFPASVLVAGNAANDWLSNIKVTDHPLGEAGYITDHVGSYIDNSTTTIINNADSNNQQAMQQQQEIADAQAEQSKKQHENLVNGYDNSANNAMIQDKGDQLNQYEQMQDNAFQMGQQHVTDFSSQYDMSPFQMLMPSMALVSTWFTRIWNGMGSFSVILTIGLVLCVAGYILKIRR